MRWNKPGGFATMDKETQRRIASKGGQMAHRKGRAHEWTRAEAIAAGRKGGLAGVKNRVDRDHRRALALETEGKVTA